MLMDSLRQLCPESRNQDRLNLQLPARVQNGFDRFRPGRTLDISRSGARLEVEAQLQPGQSVLVNLTPEPMRQLALRGEVVWVGASWREGRNEVGIRFQLVPKVEQVWLDRLGL